jgi:hypothetical protein
VTFRDPPQSVRGIVVGRSGSGKTEWMRRRWIADAPRVLILDQTGEWRKKEPMARFSVGYGDTIKALHEVAHRSHWRIVASLTLDESYQLFGVLIPIPDVYDSPATHLGGFVIFIDEADLVVPQHAPEVARSLFRRSRHAGLTVLSATQRISNVNKEATSQCDFIGIMAIHEPACQDYLRTLMGREKMEEALAWAEQPYCVAVFRPQTRELIKLGAES